jgi:hypothetical protein
VGPGQGKCSHGQPIWYNAAAWRMARLRKEPMVSAARGWGSSVVKGVSAGRRLHRAHKRRRLQGLRKLQGCCAPPYHTCVHASRYLSSTAGLPICFLLDACTPILRTAMPFVRCAVLYCEQVRPRGSPQRSVQSQGHHCRPRSYAYTSTCIRAGGERGGAAGAGHMPPG